MPNKLCRDEGCPNSGTEHVCFNPPLTDVQRKMLTGPFYVDGWHNRSHLGDAEDLVRRGLLTKQEGGDDQYTGIRYQPVSTPLNPQPST